MNNTIASTKTQRYQITLPKTPEIAKRVDSLLKKFNGLSLTEIVKLALIELDNKSTDK